MNKERELLRAALDFLYPRRWVEPEQQQVLDVLTRAIEELLAQPEHIPDVGNRVEQEPVAWIDPENYKQVIAKPQGALRFITRTPSDGDIPLYTSPPQREPLSDEEIFEIGYKAGFAIDGIEGDLALDYGFLDEDGDVDNEPYFKLVRAIEKAHGIGVEQ